ncbi:putative toxin [Cellulomonas sp. NPDC055163]
MSALVHVFGVPQSWRRVVPGAAFAALAGLVVTTGAAAPARATVPEPAPSANTSPAAASDAQAGPLTAADLVSARAIARLTGERVEVLGERTIAGSVFALPDGSLASGQGSGPVWVRLGGDGTSEEEWAPVDLTLVVGEDGLVRPVAQVANLVLSGGTDPAAARDAQASEQAASEVAPAPSPSSSTPAADAPASPLNPSASPTPAPTAGGDQPVTGAEGSAAAAAVDVPSVEIASVSDPVTGTVTRVAWEGELPAPRLEGRRATYESVEPGTDLVIEATSTGFEQFFVVHERPAGDADLTFPLTVTTDGEKVEVAPDGSLSVHSDAGQIVARAAVPAMWDADSDAGRAFPVTEPRPAEDADTPALAPMPDFIAERDGTAPADDPASESIASPVVGDGRVDPLAEAVEVPRDVQQTAAAEVAVELAPSEDFLQDPDTTYPVVVDPGVTIETSWDTYVIKGYSDNRSEEAELHIGTYNSGTNITRSYLNFPVGQFAGATVYEARLELFNSYSWSCQNRNWQVWNTYPSGYGSTWANQPGWAQHFATSNETHGYSSACAGSWSYANITSFAQKWAADGEIEGHVGLRAENESDNFSYKRFLSSNYGALIPTIWVNYNHTPNAPTNLRIDNAGINAGGASAPTLTPTLRATITDTNGGGLNAHFRIQRGTDGVLVYDRVVAGSAGTDVALAVEPGYLHEGTPYAWTVSSGDCCVMGPQAPWAWFDIDTKNPLAPTIRSDDYPTGGAWKGAAGREGSFLLKPSGAYDTTLRGFIWGLDKAPDPNQFLAEPGSTGEALLKATPATPGRHVLRVQAIDRAGNKSGVVEHVFYVGRAGIVTPEDNTRVVNHARLYVTGEPGFTHVKFQWRRGPDSLPVDIKDVLPGYLTSSSGTPWAGASWLSAAGFAPMPANAGYTTWDVAKTLGATGGPIQVRAVVATDAQGGGLYADTNWVTLIVDPDADGAATASVGPGSVNLLTGDYGLSVTDAEEFGLTLARTTSSRDTDSGYQLQVDRLTATQRDASALTGVGGSADVAIDTTRFHSDTLDPTDPAKKATSFKITPRSGVGDSYVSLGGDVGTTTVMEPGRTYRVSGWIYVPSATGLGSTNDRALSMAVFAKKPDGNYTVPVADKMLTPRPTLVDAWQQLTVDVTIPSGATESFVRLYNGHSDPAKVVFFDDLSVRELWAPFGKQWAIGTADAAAGTAYTHVSKPYDDVAAVHLAGGGEVWFTSGNGTQWWPEPGAGDLTLTVTSTNSWRVTELDGTVTDFARDNPAATTFPVRSTSPPGTTSATRHVYELVGGQVRLKRIIAPIEDGVDGWPTKTDACTSATPVRGCEVLELVYAQTTTATGTGTTGTLGSFAGQVEALKLWTTTPAGVVADVVVARYRYDSTGRLIQVWDPRLNPPNKAEKAPAAGDQVTVYEYHEDGTGKVTAVTGPGEEPFRFTYGKAGGTTTGTGDFIDSLSGRLHKVSRRTLVPGSATQWLTDANGKDVLNESSVVYKVPLTIAKGGPYDLGPAQLAAWSQTDGPTDATAIFGPQDPPNVANATATVTSPGPSGYRPATVHYLNADGREVNTASPVSKGAPAEGFIATAEYDRFGNVVRTLDASNRLLALGKNQPCINSQGQTYHCLHDWQLTNLTAPDASVHLSQALDSRTVYSADGLDVIASRGPAQRLADGNDPDKLLTMFPVTRTTYDEDKPDGVAYHLPTTLTSGALLPGADLVTGALQDVTVTKHKYDPIDQTIDDLDPTSGWVHKQPTAITIDAGRPTALTSTVVYDRKGRPLRSSKPGSNGADPSTTMTVLYVAGAQVVDGIDCGNHPEWAGQPCLTKMAGPVTGHDPTRMSTTLPVKHVAEYNQFGSPRIIKDSATGPVAGATITQSRTTITDYDEADRVTAVQITGSGTGVGTPIEKTETVYDPATGEVTENRSVNATGVIAAVRKSYDKLSRLVTYTDATGATTITTYDRYGNPDTTTEKLGTRTIGETKYTYDRAKDPRGFVTSFSDSVAGDFEATWGPDGQLQTQKLPGGVTLSIGYDPARVPVSRSYTRTRDGEPIAGDAVIENHRGQWVRHSSNTGQRDYEYDRLGRLTRVEDTSATKVCTTRTYGYASQTNPASANRTSFGTMTGVTGQPCAEPTPTAASTYDTADRLKTSPGTEGSSWTYDPLGRVTSMATPDGSAKVTNGFYVNDLIASQTQEGTEQFTWKLDPLQRRSSFESFKWVTDSNGTQGWASQIKKISHYGSDSDEPTWIQEDSTLPDDLTRYVAGVEGALAVTTKGQNAAKDKLGRVLHLVDLHGDVIANLEIDKNAVEATWTTFSPKSYDEFGVPQPLSGAGATTGPPTRYGWLGAAQRSAEALGGVILMGVRLYSPATGRFLSVDPVAGGSASAYDYCNADPVNCTDLAGTFSWKGALKTLAVVGEVASMIPGPVGAVAGGVSAVAYLATGDKQKALAAAGGAVLGLVGLGAVAGAAKALRGVAAGRKAAGATQRIARAQRAAPGCSFEPGTPVAMADGSYKTIETIAVGDLVLASDPLTGVDSAQPVVTPIKSSGLKHLYEIYLQDAPDVPIVVTGNHPFFVPSGNQEGWIAAESLGKNDVLRTTLGSKIKVERVEDLGTFDDHIVYNLSVANVHTYFVAPTPGIDVLVHNAAGRAACEVGKAGEVAAGIRKNNASITVNGRSRTPDELDLGRGIIGEVKNVKYQHLSTQIKDYLDYAKKHRLQMHLYVRRGTGTRLSRPLQAKVDSGAIQLHKRI